MPLHRLFSIIVFAVVLLGWYTHSPSAAAIAATGAGADRTLLLQRERFRSVYPEIERGKWPLSADDETLLKDYVLWPDLGAAYLSATLKAATPAAVDAFLNKYGTLKPARDLRYRYALQLARREQLSDFLSIYQSFYQGVGSAKLDCLALQAEIDAGHSDRITSRGVDLWLTGKSQAKECDPVFDVLRRNGHLTAAHYLERYELAVKAKQFSLARYLSRQLPERYQRDARQWLAAQNDPAAFIEQSAAQPDNHALQQQLAYAVERLTYRDALRANGLWLTEKTRRQFPDATLDRIDRHIALWAARQHQPAAAEMLRSLRRSARDTETARWLVRARLRQHDWPGVIRAIDEMPAEERAKADWQYWKAVALKQAGSSDVATELFETVANERSYYGFLSADERNRDYAMASQSLPNDASVAATLATMPELVRARELFHVGLLSRGRSEWDAVVKTLDAAEQVQAALLADRWGWHSRAIATVATAGAYDDLRVRYPLPWREAFSTYSKTAGIDHSLAYGIARNESLFMRDVRSSAGAIGLMQLMPATGRETAKEIALPYRGLSTLTDSTNNIRLGTHYLGKMLARFDDNPILAAAAYNAGPHRVDAWLPEKGQLDARIWIENIPFNETRAYVRRVLEADAIFHWRLTGAIKRVSSELPAVGTGSPMANVSAGRSSGSP